jgi:hypothetical protein
MATKSKCKFAYGDKVRVLDGTRDPDFNLEIGGWTGVIEDIELLKDGTWLCCVVWDKPTLQKMGRKLIRRCDRNNLDHTMTCLLETELDLMTSSTSSEDFSFLA